MKISHLFIAACVVLLNRAPALASVLPDNDLHLQDQVDKTRNLTPAQYEAQLVRIERVFAPIARQLGGELVLRRMWSDVRVNAAATRDQNHWYVSMYGGLARRAELTADGFTLAVCHEIGHHMAGFPFSGTWASDEGQSDYFAAHVCVPKLWSGETQQNAAARRSVEPLAKRHCDDVWNTQSARDLCYRSMNAGHSLATLLGALKGHTVDFSQPDSAQVEATFHRHPAAQCRLDTYVAGATCLAEAVLELIPGMRGGRGYNDDNAETASAQFNCSAQSNYTVGLRPRCWFKPNL